LLRAATVLAVLAFTSAFRQQPTPSAPDRPVAVRADGYTSSASCRECHPSQFDTWRRSYHRTMTQLATEETVRADFSDVRVSGVQKEPMLLTRRGEQFWAEFDDPDRDRSVGGPSRIERQIVIATGSHHQQVYWYATGRGRLLGQLPGTYLLADGRWIPRQSSFLRPPGDASVSETGRWNGVCINCHTTHGKSALAAPLGTAAPAAQNAATTVTEFGIACEACHGPAEEHVRAKRGQSPDSPRPGRDSNIVQPRRLSPLLSSQVCGQCHSVWEFHDAAAVRQANVDGFPYRPGDDLRKTRLIVQPATSQGQPRLQALLARYPQFLADSFWSDGMIRVSGREYNGLIDSPCYKKARDENRTLSCFSCHTLHKKPGDPRPTDEWADTHQVSEGKGDAAACLPCHQKFAADPTTHTKHRPGSAGSSCYNCHMPHTTYGLLKALRSHQISTPSVATSLDTGRPNACNLCHLDKTLQWTAAHLETWYGTPRRALTAEERTIAASLLWMLRGDAGQRALVAWSMGWQPAREASGQSWMPPYLGLLLDDPYDAVRFIAARSLRSVKGMPRFDYDVNAPSAQRIAAAGLGIEAWQHRGVPGDRPNDSALLLDGDGWPILDRALALLRARDDRRVNLRE
jgi:hypothetical protein